MLVAASNLSYGESRVRTAFCVERQFRAHLVWRHRLLFDSRYAAPARTPADVATIYLSLEGNLETAAGRLESPAGFALHEREFERVQPGADWFRSWGDPAVVLNVRVPTADVAVPIGLAHGPLPLVATWDAFAALAEVTAIDGDLAPALRGVLHALYRDGVLRRDFAHEIHQESALIRRLWDAVLPFYQRFMVGSSMEDLGHTRGASLRQLVRETTALTAALPIFGGFRHSVTLLRLRLAGMLLSSPSATLAEVAGWSGYASVEAMTGAFRAGGLPPPSVIRASTRYPEP